MIWYHRLFSAAVLAFELPCCSPVYTDVHGVNPEKEKIEHIRTDALAKLRQHRYHGVTGELLERYLDWVENPTLREVCVAAGLVYFGEVEFFMQSAGRRYVDGQWVTERDVPDADFYLHHMQDAKSRLQKLLAGDCREFNGL